MLRIPPYALILIALLSPIAFGSDGDMFRDGWRWREFGRSEGLPAEHISSVLIADDGVPWVHTPAGLAHFDGFHWNHVTEEDGLPAERLDAQAPAPDSGLLVAHEGKLYRGGVRGFHPVAFEDPDMGRIHQLVRYGPDIILSGAHRDTGQPLLRRVTEVGFTSIAVPPGDSVHGLWVNDEELCSLTNSGVHAWNGARWTVLVESTIAGRARFFSHAHFFRASPEESRGLWKVSGRELVHVAHLVVSEAVDLSFSPSGQGLVALDSGRFQVSNDDDWSEQLSELEALQGVTSIAYDPSGSLWVGTHHGLYLWKKELPYTEILPTPESGTPDRIHDLLLARDGTLWAVTRLGIEVRSADGEYRSIREIGGVSLADSTGLAQDGKGRIWVTSGSSFPGAFCHEDDEWTYYGPEQGLTGFCHKVKLDRSGRPWLLSLSDVSSPPHTRGEGAFLFDGEKFQRWSTDRGLASGRVYGFVEDRSGAYWFGTYRGLSRFHNDEWKHWTTSNGLREGRVWALAVTEDDVVCFSDRQNGVGYIDGAGTAKYVETWGYTITNDCWDLRSDPLGGVWASCRGGVLRITSRGTERGQPELAVQQRIPSTMFTGQPWLWPVLPAPTRLYVGTVGSGIVTIDRERLETLPLRVRVTHRVGDGAAQVRWRAVSRGAEVDRGSIVTRYRLGDEAWSEWGTVREKSYSLDPGEYEFSVQARLIASIDNTVTTTRSIDIAPSLTIYRHPLFVTLAILTALLAGTVATYLAVRHLRKTRILEEKERRYGLATEAAHSGIWDWNIETGECYIDPNLKEMLGYSEEEIPNDREAWLRRIHGIDRQAVEKATRDHIEGRTAAYVQEYRIADKAGEQRWFLSQGHLIADESGRPRRMIGTTIDITDRKSAVESLHESEERFRVLVERMPAVTYIVELDENLTDRYVSPFVENLTGYTSEEWYGRPKLWRARIDNEYRDEVIANLETSLANGELYIAEYPFFRKDGTRIWIRDEAVVVADSEGQPAFAQGLMLDITERRRAEEEEHKEKKIESLGLLAGGIAHDFNNILMSVLGSLSLARRRGGDAEEVEKLLGEAESAILRARGLTQQLLTFSKGGAPVKARASIGRLVHESASFVLRGTNVRLKFDADDELWPASVDDGQISQVVENIVINGGQAMAGGGVVHVRCDNHVVSELDGLPLKPGKFVRISIRDEGVGMSAESVERVFDPYFTTKDSGTGLGMTISYAIVKKHEGHVLVESIPGRGTTFVVYLPASPGEVPRVPPDPAIEKGTGRVLVMDDDPSVRAVTGQLLEHLGYEYELAEGGADAVELYQRAMHEGRRFDAVILDLTVPGGLGGKVTVERLRSMDPAVRAIVASGYSDDPVLARFGEYGFVACLIKPFDLDRLAEVMNEVFDSRAAVGRDHGDTEA